MLDSGVNLRAQKKTDQPLNQGIVLALSGILIYKGLGIFKSFIVRLLFLVFPKHLLASFYFSNIYDVLVIAGIIWLIVLIVKKKRIGFLDRLNTQFFQILGVSFVILFLANFLLIIFSDDYFSNTFGEYIEESEVLLGQAVISQEVFRLISQNITGALFIVLFFLSIRKLDRKRLYEWPITGKNEQVVPSSMDLDGSENAKTNAVKLDNDGDWSSLSDVVIYFNDNTCALIWGDYKEGYTVTEVMDLSEIPQEKVPDLTDLDQKFEASDGDYIAITGETSWGGAGFIRVKKTATDSVEWIMHLSTMNNPVALSFKSGIIQVKTDLNFPYGVLYTVPVHAPENFSAKILTGEGSST